MGEKCFIRISFGLWDRARERERERREVRREACEKRVKKSKCQKIVYLNKSNNQLSDAYTHIYIHTHIDTHTYTHMLSAYCKWHMRKIKKFMIKKEQRKMNMIIMIKGML